MGLDTSHDCWHGSYSSFNIFRHELAMLAGMNLSDMEGFGGNIPFKPNDEEPLNILLNHSDCDGVIDLHETLPLAQRLMQVLRSAQNDKQFDMLRANSCIELHIKEFADGLMSAHDNNEVVDFH